MARSTTQFICQQCGATYSKWSGRCDNCGNWNTLVENTALPESQLLKQGKVLKPTSRDEVKAQSAKLVRIGTGMKDVDLVLGGGIIPASVVLLAGQPGIGKSTLLMQIAKNIATNEEVLYVSGEESVEQVASRGERLGKGDIRDLDIVSSTSADDIAATIASAGYKLVIVDSIQTIGMQSISSAAGSVSQVTNCVNLLTRVAKQHNTALIIVGHVTKEGSIAGPKLLEHLVDVVVNLEGDRYGGFKILRAIKNRYGSTQEAGILEMTHGGLVAVENPSAALLAERQASDGSIVLATLEGNRPLLVEVQALVTKSNFGYPKRTASGFDANRLNLLIAVLERRTSLDLSDKDVYINIVGGFKLNDPASDLAICMAIASSCRQMKLPEDIAVVGEIGLSGEIRRVPQIESRCKEAARIGFTTTIGPSYGKKITHLTPIRNLRDALNTYLKPQEKK